MAEQQPEHLLSFLAAVQALYAAPAGLQHEAHRWLQVRG
jgi:hypothetical protein